MKKQLFTFTAVIGLALVLNVGTFAQNTLAIRAEIPFDFAVNGKTLPAGTYRIDPATDSRIVWRIRGDTSRHAGAFVLAGSLSPGNLRRADASVTFHRYGEKSFLVGFKTPSYEVDLPTSKAELSLRSVAGMVVSKVIATSGVVDVMSH